uniref:Large ribosomal subunit protein uL23c n=1 Tax=Cryptoglena skujai TaxID=161229 RepID=A0A0G3SFL1_9EUGL|nr:ribosomal protein L23 [Cryptoglena skujai]AKL39041.1 ribosomal protein L23 [Cryptoglena skujai]
MIDLIKSQVLTDKSTKLLQQNKYTFDVSVRLNKPQVKQLIEEVFDVKVISLNSLILPSKKRRLGKFEGFKNVNKRFFITLASEKLIPFFSTF